MELLQILTLSRTGTVQLFFVAIWKKPDTLTGDYINMFNKIYINTSVVSVQYFLLKISEVNLQSLDCDSDLEK